MKQDITFTMIKPAAVEKGFIVPILSKINYAGFRIKAMKLTRLTKENAKLFYAEHKEKSFFEDLTDFMSSGPIVAAMLEKTNAVEDFRKLIGTTNPLEAEEGTIRKTYAESVEKNAIHGSDSPESAERESNFFFNQFEKF